MNTIIYRINEHYDEVAHTASDTMQVETARAMILSYAMHYEKVDAATKVRGVEVPFCVEIPKPDDLNPIANTDKPRFLTGVIDSIIERNGRLLATDLKTASRVQDYYWEELHTNLQLTTYAFALAVSGYDNVGWEWDVITKPSINPKRVTKAAIAELEEFGTYCGWPTNESVPEDGDESPKMFGIRLLQWYAENPDSKLMRRSYSRNETELLAFVYESHYSQSAMERSIQEGGDPYLSQRNYNACTNYGELCEYHPICCGRDPEKLGFKSREKREGSFEVGISTSQLRCFQSCGFKWKMKYVDRIEPKISQPKRAADLGSLVHSGREVYLLHRLENPIVLPIEGQPAVGLSI